MKVKDFIKTLKNMDQDKEIWFSHSITGTCFELNEDAIQSDDFFNEVGIKYDEDYKEYRISFDNDVKQVYIIEVS